jgi:parallel beta-helix repeat protein
VIEAHGGTVSVKNMTIDGSALKPGCSPETTVGGVFFLEAAGAISGATITNISRGQGYRCGYGIVIVGPTPAPVTVVDNAIGDPGDAGIIVTGAAVEMRRNIITNSGADGIALGAQGTSGTIDDNTIRNAGRAGISLEDSAMAAVTSNEIIDSALGMTAITGSSVEITDENRISGGQAGIVISDAGTRATIAGNAIDHPAKDGIYVQRGATATIKENAITDSAGSAITLADSHGAIERNTIHAPLVNGILVRGSDGVDVIGNTVYGPGTTSIDAFFGPFGIHYATDAGGAVRGNTISNYRSEQPASVACAIAIGLLAGQVEVGENAFPPPGNTSNVCDGVAPEEWGLKKPVATPVGTPAA